MKPKIVWQGTPSGYSSCFRIVSRRDSSNQPSFVVERVSHDALGNQAWLIEDNPEWIERCISDVFATLPEFNGDRP